VSDKIVVTYVVDDNQEPRFQRLPRWKRTVAVADNGEIFGPASVAGAEMSVFLCASYDGTRCVMVDRHPFFPLSWMAQEFPAAKEACDAMERGIRTALQGEGLELVGQAASSAPLAP
jgi:hypothetical protein